MRIPSYNRQKYSDIWNDVEKFKEAYYTQELAIDWQDDELTDFYFLSMGKWANNIIANYDVNQWKYKFWGIVYQYGREWKAKRDIQIRVLDMQESELKEGDQSISNHANNPSNPPSTGATGELEYVDDQNVVKRVRGTLESLQYKLSMLQSRYNEEFLSKFESLFTKFCPPYLDAFFCTDKEDEEEEEEK